MKKSIFILLAIVLLIASLFVLSACAEKKVSDEQLVEDLSNHESIVNIFESEAFETKPFKYDSHSIIKRQTNLEKKEDLIYCTLTASNKNFSVTADCELNYNYYDEGGWILDKVKVSNRKVTPTGTFTNKEILDAIIKADTNTEVYSSIEEHGEKTGVSVLGSEIISENGSYKMRVSLKYKRSLSVLEGYMDIPFDNESGWTLGDDESDDIPVTPTKIVEADYQKAVGVFEMDWGLDYFKLYVDSINIEEGYAEIRFEKIGSFGFWYKDGQVMKCPFDVYSGTIDTSAENLNVSLFVQLSSFTYDVSLNNWD